MQSSIVYTLSLVCTINPTCYIYRSNGDICKAVERRDRHHHYTRVMLLAAICWRENRSDIKRVKWRRCYWLIYCASNENESALYPDIFFLCTIQKYRKKISRYLKQLLPASSIFSSCLSVQQLMTSLFDVCAATKLCIVYCRHRVRSLAVSDRVVTKFKRR